MACSTGPRATSQRSMRRHSLTAPLLCGMLFALAQLAFKTQMFVGYTERAARAPSSGSRGQRSWHSIRHAEGAKAEGAKAEGAKAEGAKAEGESFDPFGWKGALKNTIAGMQDALADEEDPSEAEEKMMMEIFVKFDLDKDGILNLNEFNALQLVTEGGDAVYNQDQLNDLLFVVTPDIKSPEKGMPFSEYRRLYVERRLRRDYNTDVYRDYAKVFPDKATPAADAAPEKDAAEEQARIKNGASVLIDGLKSATDLNGKEGLVVTPEGGEVELVLKEGRIIVKLEDGERIALRPDNVKLQTKVE